MTEPTNPAGTPPAQNPEGGKTPAEQGKTLTQAQVDEIVEERLGRDRRSREEALAKDLGMPLKDVKAIIKAKKESDEAQKTELEKLTSELGQHKTEAESARIEAAKLRALMKAGADPDKIDALLKRVVGSTPEEIEADVAELASLGLLQAKTPSGAQGAGNPGLQKQPHDPDIDEQIAAMTALARTDPRYNTHLMNLKLKKQAVLFK